MNRLLARLGVHRREHVSVARDFSVYSAVNFFSMVLLVSTNLWLTRYLGPAAAGIWSALDLIPGYASYSHFGILSAAERELPFLLGAGREREFDDVKNTVRWLTHALGLVLTAALVIGAIVYRAHLPRVTFVGLLLYAPLIWTQLMATYYLTLYRARKHFVTLSRRQGTANLTKTVLRTASGLAFGLYGVLGAEVASAILLIALLRGGLDEQFAPVFDRRRLRQLLTAGLPMLAGGVAFETLRPGGATGADQTVILAALGAAPLGVYRITAVVCQGLFYLPNALSVVMYPRFQERYGRTQSAASLRRFVELQLHVLADILLAAITVLLIALPPAIVRFFPRFADTIGPLRICLVATYFVALAPPAGQFLLTVRKQLRALFIAVPATGLAFAAGYLGSRYGIEGVAVGIAFACFAEFIAINAYALSHFSPPVAVVAEIAEICGTAAVWLFAAFLVVRMVPAGPPVIAVVGGWQLVVGGLLALPLAIRGARRVRAIQTPDSVDNVRAGH